MVKSLNDKERDFLIHARLAHLPSKQILKLIKQGNTGLPFTGKFSELCRPCLEARQKAHCKGKHADRNKDGKVGEHLHSDLAVVSTVDFNGFKYVLTIVDEISDEIVAVLLKNKEGDNVLNACKKAHAIITSRAKSSLKTWQFDRGSEFMNKAFDQWIHLELGAKQLFSNVEHPWENGIAERSFQTIFAKARAMMKHADLPNYTWGKAVLHAVYLKNRSPSSSTGISPLHFRTGSPFNFDKIRVFGCPAQIFIRPSARLNPKLSNRSEQGTFLGMSNRGNGYIFLVSRTRSFVEIDSKDVLFNETFSDCRDRKGRIIPHGVILKPDLHDDSDFDTLPSKDGIVSPPPSKDPIPVSNRFETLSDPDDPSNDAPEVNTIEPSQAPTPPPVAESAAPPPVPILAPTTKTSSKYWFYETVPPTNNAKGDRLNDGPKSQAFFQVLPSKRVSQPTNPIASSVLQALLAQSSDPYNPELDILLSSLESGVPSELCLLTSSRASALHTAFESVFYDGPDPKSQKDIDRLPPAQAKRYNDDSIQEFNGMKQKQVMELVPLGKLPRNTQVYPSVVNWTTKKVLGVYTKTKCRICFGGHLYDKTYTDCFAPTVNFNSVLMVICFAAMFGWHLGSLDYSQAYLNADIDELCVMRAPSFLREYTASGEELYLYWKLNKLFMATLRVLDFGQTAFIGNLLN